VLLALFGNLYIPHYEQGQSQGGMKLVFYVRSLNNFTTSWTVLLLLEGIVQTKKFNRSRNSIMFLAVSNSFEYCPPILPFNGKRNLVGIGSLDNLN
jgi:hypothetical protein